MTPPLMALTIDVHRELIKRIGSNWPAPTEHLPYPKIIGVNTSHNLLDLHLGPERSLRIAGLASLLADEIARLKVSAFGVLPLQPGHESAARWTEDGVCIRGERHFNFLTNSFHTRFEVLANENPSLPSQ